MQGTPPPPPPGSQYRGILPLTPVLQGHVGQKRAHLQGEVPRVTSWLSPCPHGPHAGPDADVGSASQVAPGRTQKVPVGWESKVPCVKPPERCKE